MKKLTCVQISLSISPRTMAPSSQRWDEKIRVIRDDGKLMTLEEDNLTAMRVLGHCSCNKVHVQGMTAKMWSMTMTADEMADAIMTELQKDCMEEIDKWSALKEHVIAEQSKLVLPQSQES